MNHVFGTALLSGLLCTSALGQTSLSYQSSPGEFIGAGVSRSYTPADGPMTVTRNVFGNPNAIEFHFQSSTDQVTWWDLLLAAPNMQVLTPGSYEGATRFPFQSTSVPGLDFSGSGRGSNMLYGRFDVLAVAYDAGGAVTSLSVNFEQHSESATAPPLFGQVRYNVPAPASLGLGSMALVLAALRRRR